MTLQQFLRVLRKRLYLVVTCLLIFTAVAAAYTYSSTKKYEASAEIFVATAATDANATNLAAGNTFSEARVQTYTSIAASPAITDAVVKQLHLTMSSAALAKEITSDAPLNKVLVNIHVTDNSPEQAAVLCNAVAQQFTTVVASLEQTSASAPSPVKLTVTKPATAPSGPVSPKKKLDIGIGFLLGLIVGIAAAVIRELFDTSVKTVVELQTIAEAPVLGVIPFDRKTEADPVAFRGDAHGLRAESFRQLRTSLQFVDVDNPPTVIAVTSAVQGEGKSTTAINLAASLAEAGKRVCLLEADLRRPTVAKTLGLVGDVGLTTILIGEATIEQVLQNAGNNLAVITSGPIPPNPSELLLSHTVREVIRTLAERVDYLVIDTAPLLPVADGAEVAALAEVTMLVVRAGRTTRDQVSRAVEALGKVAERPVGTVLNRAAKSNSGEYGYYYYDYRPTKEKQQRGRRAAEPEPRRSRRDRDRDDATV